MKKWWALWSGQGADNCRKGKRMEGYELVEGRGYFRKIVCIYGAIIHQSTFTGGKNCVLMGIFAVWDRWARVVLRPPSTSPLLQLLQLRMVHLSHSAHIRWRVLIPFLSRIAHTFKTQTHAILCAFFVEKQPLSTLIFHKKLVAFIDTIALRMHNSTGYSRRLDW